MNNTDINEAIANARGMMTEVVDTEVWAGKKYDGDNVRCVLGVYDPVNRLDQALPLIVEAKLDIDWKANSVFASSGTDFCRFKDENDLAPAICSVYLQVK